MYIYIFRHGQTIWNASKLLQGRSDIELNENGIRLAEETGRNLADVHFDRIYSSPLKRAYNTACLIRGGRDIEIIKDDRLKELCFGEYEGRNFVELLADETDPFYYFYDHPELYKAPANGETLEEITKRAEEFLVSEIEPLKDKCERIMIVAHGALNKALLRHIRQNELKDYWQGGLQRNCSAAIVSLDDSGYGVIDDSKLFYELKKQEG